MSPLAREQGNGGRHPSMPDDDDDSRWPLVLERLSRVEDSVAMSLSQGAELQAQLGRLDVDPERSTGLVGMVVRLSNQVSVLTHDAQRSQFEGEVTRLQTRAELVERVRAAEHKDSTPPAGVAIKVDRGTAIKIAVAMLIAIGAGGGLARIVEVLK